MVKFANHLAVIAQVNACKRIKSLLGEFLSCIIGLLGGKCNAGDAYAFTCRRCRKATPAAANFQDTRVRFRIQFAEDAFIFSC